VALVPPPPPKHRVAPSTVRSFSLGSLTGFPASARSDANGPAAVAQEQQNWAMLPVARTPPEPEGFASLPTSPPKSEVLAATSSDARLGTVARQPLKNSRRGRRSSAKETVTKPDAWALHYLEIQIGGTRHVLNELPSVCTADQTFSNVGWGSSSMRTCTRSMSHRQRNPILLPVGKS
jgi:hypothetical protein